MRRFELVEPRTLEEACGLLSDNNEARAIAGGTALLTLIKHGVFLPKTLVNLKKIKGATEIDYDPQRGLRVGALTTIYDVESSPLVQRLSRASDACHVVANIRIHNVATIGVTAPVTINRIRRRCWSR
jgi:carbon-monoxide dehydrogenase medium subunit